MERLKRPAAAGIAAVAATLFACLATAVTHAPANRFDLDVRRTVHAWATPQLTFAMRGLTWLGSSAVLIPLGILLGWRLLAAGRRGAVAMLALAVLGGEAWDQGLKLVFERQRPEAFFGLAQPETYSFPSGHSMASGCFYGALAIIVAQRAGSRVKRLVIYLAAAILVATVGFSRIYLGVHYPTDVLGGYLGALAWLAAIAAFTTPEAGGAPVH